MLNNKTSKHVAIDGIISYKLDISERNNDYNKKGLDNIYAVERKHFWHIYRRKLIVKAFLKFSKKSNSICDIGSGTGYIASGLQDEGYNVSVGDLHMSGLKYAQSMGIKSCFQFDLFDPPFYEKFDSIGMFDVIEHLDRDVFALMQVSKMLKPKGKIFITVPAHQWLWSREDSIAFHKRRYSKKELLQVIEDAGFKVLECRFFFIFMLPILFLRRLIYKDTAAAVSTFEINKPFYFNASLNKILILFARFESYFDKWLPTNIAGGSLFLVAEKIK